jgi:hypothetical protein
MRRALPGQVAVSSGTLPVMVQAKLRVMLPVLALWLGLATGCGGSDGTKDIAPDVQSADVPGEMISDLSNDVLIDIVSEVSMDLVVDVAADAQDVVAPDAQADSIVDAPVDVPADNPFDIEVVTTSGGLPYSLPFVYRRPDVGTPLTDEEVTVFTSRITGLWKQIRFFDWAAETSAGVDVSTGEPDYLIWWHDFVAVKAGDTVTFRANAADGGSHNNAEPTGVVLASALVGHLASNDESIRYIVEQYTKSQTACMKGFLFDSDDTVDWLMSRNITADNHAFELPDGRKKVVEYDEWHFAYTGWNADRFRYQNNPIWGDIWVTNKRSKDDLPYLYRVAAWLPYVVEMSPDATVRAAATEALDLMRKSAQDIVESGWKVRTKDADGQIFIPETEDLASFVAYTDFIPDAECDGRLSTALLGYGDTLDVDCGSGQGSPYDQIATTTHYFNYDIITYFHQVAALLALTTGHAEEALALVEGLATRISRYRDPSSGESGLAEADFPRDISMYLLRAAVTGLPLTSEEARLVHKFHIQSVDEYKDFPNWNLWDASVPDGTYSFRDGFHPKYRSTAIRIEDIAALIEYCGSPFKNPAGVRFVDCDVVLDPTRWGTP